MDNAIRTGQLLSPFGVGQIISFPDEVSLMVGGLNLWDDILRKRKETGGHNAVDEREFTIKEERLQKLLGVEFFRKPFPYKERGITNNLLEIPAVRFPGWFHCTNPNCGRMKEKPLNYQSDKVECLMSEGGCGWNMIPVRFVAVCERGHIKDVPFIEWVHHGPQPNDGKNHQLSYHAHSGSGDLSSIIISCSCGSSRSLAGIMNVRKGGESNKIFDSALARIGLEDSDGEFSESEPNTKRSNPSGEFCTGEKPWLGLDGIHNHDECDGHLRVLVRGGSNVHYSNIQSAIYLPRVTGDKDEYLQKVFDEVGYEKLKGYYEQNTEGSLLRVALENTQYVKRGVVSIEELYEEVRKYITESKSDFEVENESDLRYEEYLHLLKGSNTNSLDFKAIVKPFDEYAGKEFLETYFDKVVLVEKLKETRVFTGFSRINPGKGDLEEKKKQLSTGKIKWLPAYQVNGEGIFLEFNTERLAEWSYKVENYFQNLIDRYHHAMSKRRVDYLPKDIDPRFILIHTFSHLLIKRLCFNCGYGSSSIRERIYFSSDSERAMNGLLIYTSSGDSEGSLGGLVRQGKEDYLSKLLQESIEDAKWCSADPVCSDIGQRNGQGPDSVNGSACHNCCLVPETSCEEFNMILDRATISGTLENPETGYFI